MVSIAFVRRIILFLSILLSGGLFLFPRTPFLLLIFVLYFFCMQKKWHMISKELIPVILLLIAILINSLFFQGNINYISLVTRFSVFFISSFIFNLYLKESPETFQADLYILLKYMPYQAILTVILTIVAPFVFITMNLSNASYKTFGLFFTYHVMLEDSTAFFRPDGLFYESGVFQIYLNILLYLTLFTYNKKWQSIIVILSIFTTQSTTGIVICFIIISIYLMKYYINKGNISKKFFKLLVGTVILLPIAFLAFNNISDKFFGEGKGSSLARQYDLLTGINVALSKPFTGIGFDYSQYTKAASALGYGGDFITNSDEPIGNLETITERGNANGIVFLLYGVGLPLGFLIIIGMFKQHFFKNNILIGLLIFLSFLTESIIFTPFFLLLIYSGIANLFYKKITLVSTN